MVKYIIAAAACVPVIYFVFTVINGRKCSASRKIWGLAAKARIAVHQKYANRALVSAVVASCAADLLVRIYRLNAPSRILSVHIALVVSFLTLLLFIRFQFNGKKYPKLHAVLAYGCFALLALGTATGLMILFHP